MSPAEALKLARSAARASQSAQADAAAAYRAAVPRVSGLPTASAMPAACCAAAAPTLSPALRHALPASASSGTFSEPGVRGVLGAAGGAAAGAGGSALCDRGGHFDRGVAGAGCGMPRCMSVPAPLAVSLGMQPAPSSPRRAPPPRAAAPAAAEEECCGRGSSAELRGEHTKDRPEARRPAGSNPRPAAPSRLARPFTRQGPVSAQRLTTRGFSASAAISMASRRLILQQQQQRAAAERARGCGAAAPAAAAAAHAAWKAAALLASPEVRDGLSGAAGGGAADAATPLRGSAWVAARLAVRGAASTAYVVNRLQQGAKTTRAGQEADLSEHVKDRPQREARKRTPRADLGQESSGADAKAAANAAGPSGAGCRASVELQRQSSGRFEVRVNVAFADETEAEARAADEARRAAEARVASMMQAAAAAAHRSVDEAAALAASGMTRPGGEGPAAARLSIGVSEGGAARVTIRPRSPLKITRSPEGPASVSISYAQGSVESVCESIY